MMYQAFGKRSWWPVAIMVVILWGLAACGSADPTPDPGPAESAADAEPAPVVRTWAPRVDVPRPERDPFAVQAAEVAERERGEIVAVGRDPFAVVGNVIDPSVPDPPDEVDPIDDNGEVVDPSPDGLLALSLVTVDRCWLDVRVDGERVIRTNVPVGQTLSWEGQTVLLEQVGREYAVSVTLNGRNLGILSQQLVPALLDGPVVYEFDDSRVRVTLAQRYLGGVLLGLRFQVID